MLCHINKVPPKTWCCTAQIFLEYSSVPAPGSLLLRYRKYLQSKAADLDPNLRDLLTRNRLEVLKNHKKVLKNSLSNATIQELPYLAYLTYKAYDIEIQELLSAQLKKMQNFDHLNFTEISIICNTMFVSKVSVNNLDLMASITSRLKKDIEKYGLHREQVSVVKFLRKMKFFDRSSISVLLMQLNSEYYPLTLTDIAHFLAWIVDSEVFPSPLSSKIIERITVEIEKSSDSLRCKDIDRILWILSFQHGVPTELVDKLIKLVYSKKSHPDMTSLMFGNILLSFAILGRYDRALIEEFLLDSRISEIKKLGMDRSRQLSRLGLFLQAVKIEASCPKSLVQTLDETSEVLRSKGISEMDVSRELQFVRKDLPKLEQAADLCSKKMNLEDIRIDMKIPYLNMSGLSFKLCSAGKKRKIAVEIVDRHTWLANNVYKPGRLLGFKIRLLKKLGWRVIVLSELELRPSKERVSEILIKKLYEMGS